MVRIVMVLLCLSVSLTGCIPTMMRVYSAPEVVGFLKYAQTGLPASGVSISHRHNQAQSVKTDETGRFLLPSISNVEGTFIMAGHALTYYEIIIISGLQTDCIRVRGSLKMLHEEKVDIGTQMVFRDQSGSCLILPNE